MEPPVTNTDGRISVHPQIIIDKQDQLESISGKTSQKTKTLEPPYNFNLSSNSHHHGKNDFRYTSSNVKCNKQKFSETDTSTSVIDLNDSISKVGGNNYANDYIESGARYSILERNHLKYLGINKIVCENKEISLGGVNYADNKSDYSIVNGGGANYANDQKQSTSSTVPNNNDIINSGVWVNSNQNVNNNHNGEHYHREEHHINQKVSNKNKILTSFLAGGLAGAIAKTTVAPLDRTKINFQTSEMKFSFRKAIQFLVMTYRKEGVRTLWRGNSATMYRIVPYAAVQFTSHEQYKILLNTGVKRKHLPPAKRVLAGSLAGITATSCTYPLDFARARMAITAKAKYRTLLDVFKTVIKDEGWHVIWRGYTPTVIGSCIYSGLGFFTYESLKIAHAEYNKGVDPTPKERWLFGALAGIVGQCSSYPLDIIRRRMQTAGVTGHSADYTSVYKTARNVYSHEGLKGGLYKGLSMNWIKGPIANGVSFMVFETVQRWLRRQSVFHIDDND